MSSNKLHELITKLRLILNHSVANWTVQGKAVCHSSDSAPLIQDHAAHPQSLVLIADALNFVVRRQALKCAAGRGSPGRLRLHIL